MASADRLVDRPPLALTPIDMSATLTDAARCPPTAVHGLLRRHEGHRGDQATSAKKLSTASRTPSGDSAGYAS